MCLGFVYINVCIWTYVYTHSLIHSLVCCEMQCCGSTEEGWPSWQPQGVRASQKKGWLGPWRVTSVIWKETRLQANILHLCNLVDESTIYFKASVDLTCLICSLNVPGLSWFLNAALFPVFKAALLIARIDKTFIIRYVLVLVSPFWGGLVFHS